MLHTIFQTLYDEDVLVEDAFIKWEENNDPAAQVTSTINHNLDLDSNINISGGQRSCIEIMHTIHSLHQGG